VVQGAYDKRRRQDREVSKMKEEDVFEYVLLLSDHFGVRPPRVEITDDLPRGWLGYYDRSKRTIYLRPLVDKRTVAHEFAHYIQHLFNIPDEKGAEEFEEVVECEICMQPFPVPITELGVTASCPECGSIYKRVK